MIVAFMQNQWVRDPEQLRRILDRHDEDFRRRMIAKLLFAGCASGRRLKAAFGDMINEIVWEEASREIGCAANSCPPADPEHIKATLQRYKPDVVLCFGKVASDAVRRLYHGALIIAPHPAARWPFVPDQLADAAKTLRAVVSVNRPRQRHRSNNQSVRDER